MLPKDAKVQKKQAQTATAQTHLNSHLHEKPVKEKVLLYSHKLFCQMAIEWLVSTDQVCVYLVALILTPFIPPQLIDALSHPKFHGMVNVVVWAPNGMSIPGHKQTQDEIINTFKDQLIDLQKWLTVCNFS